MELRGTSLREQLCELPETSSVTQLRRSRRIAFRAEASRGLTEKGIQNLLLAERSPSTAPQGSREVLSMVPPQIEVEDPTTIESDVKKEEQEIRMSEIPWVPEGVPARQASSRRYSRDSLELSEADQSLSPVQQTEAERSVVASSCGYSFQAASNSVDTASCSF